MMRQGPELTRSDPGIRLGTRWRPAESEMSGLQIFGRPWQVLSGSHDNRQQSETMFKVIRESFRTTRGETLTRPAQVTGNRCPKGCGRPSSGLANRLLAAGAPR